MNTARTRIENPRITDSTPPEPLLVYNRFPGYAKGEVSGQMFTSYKADGGWRRLVGTPYKDARRYDVKTITGVRKKWTQEQIDRIEAASTEEEMTKLLEESGEDADDDKGDELPTEVGSRQSFFQIARTPDGGGPTESDEIDFATHDDALGKGQATSDATPRHTVTVYVWTRTVAATFHNPGAQRTS